MQIVILGSGTSIPLNDRSSPSLALIVDDNLILFDMGPGTLRQLAKAGIDFEDIRQIFITHLHPDHNADLIHLLFACMIPSVLERKSRFVITGPEGLRELIHRLQHAYVPWLNLPTETMEIQELAIGRKTQWKTNGLKIIASPTNHTNHSLAYRVETPSGKSFVYSGDTGFCDDMVDLAKGADLLVLECSFPDGKGVAGHLTPSQAGAIAALAEPHQLVLTHFYPECLAVDIEGQCRRTYEGNLILAHDLLRIHV